MPEHLVSCYVYIIYKPGQLYFCFSYMHQFCFMLFLHCFTQDFKHYWIEMENMDNLSVLISNFKCFEVFRSFSLMLIVGFSYMPFLHWGMLSLCLTAPWWLSWKNLNFYQRYFSECISMIMWFSLLINFLRNTLHMWNHFYLTEINSTWFWWMDYLVSLLQIC